MEQLLALGLGSQCDPLSQQKATQALEQLKQKEEGWLLCANGLTNTTYHQVQENEFAKFFCFSVIEHHLKTRYINASQEETRFIQTFLLTWFQQQCHKPENSVLCNKAAQVFSLAFVVDYPARWPCFFTDLLNALSIGDRAIDMYLKIMDAIDSEVADRDIVHTPQEIQRNTMLKDAMRVTDNARLVDSWYHILTTCQESKPETVCVCLDMIGKYVSWIDIGLIVNDRFVPTLLRFMTMPLLKESACECIHEIISKGMEPLEKHRLIESFVDALKSTGVLPVGDEDDGDFLAKLAKLINMMGLQLILAWQNLCCRLVKTKDVENTKMILSSIEAKVEYMFKFLGSEDDDVSEAVSQFAHDYLTLIKQLDTVSDQHKQHVKELLAILVRKMKYDDGYNFEIGEDEGEEEGMFQEYRKQLKVIFNNIGALDGDLLIVTVQDLFSRTIQNWQNASFQDVEVAMLLLYQLGESLPVSHGQHFSDATKSGAIQQMMKLLLTNKVSMFQHPAVQMQFFQTVVRYDKFFNVEPQYIPDVLTAFLDERGLRNKSDHIRSRTAYLFSRFVKDINKQHFHAYLEVILSRVHDLLVLHSPDNGTTHILSGDDQNFLYESTGILIVHSQFPPEKKQELMKQLLAPIVTRFEPLMQKLVAEQNEERQQAYAECLSQAMAFASRTSKGFSNQQTMKQCGCVEAYTETLAIFLLALNIPVHRPILHQGVRQFLHRMVVCLEVEVLPFIPMAMENLLKNADAKELHDFIPLINQVVIKFKKHIVPFLESVFMPVVSTIYNVLLSPIDTRDQVAANELKMLQRGYYSFLSTLVSNNVSEVLSNQESKNLEEVLGTVITGAVDIPDPTGQKTCFSILKKLVEVWGGKNGLNGFADFIYKRIVPACFMAPMKPTFDLSDAQTCLVLNECAACLATVREKQGDEFIAYLQNEYLPGQNMAPEMTLQFCQALKGDTKVFRNYFKSFFMKAKS